VDSVGAHDEVEGTGRPAVEGDLDAVIAMGQVCDPVVEDVLDIVARRLIQQTQEPALAALAAVATSGAFATVLRIANEGDFDLDFDTLFEFGLTRVLDGLEVFIGTGYSASSGVQFGSRPNAASSLSCSSASAGTSTRGPIAPAER
jgi:hypothetical protein